MSNQNMCFGSLGISADEQEKRRQAVNYAISTVALEGLAVSSEAKAIYEKYIAGDLTLEDVQLQILNLEIAFE